MTKRIKNDVGFVFPQHRYQRIGSIAKGDAIGGLTKREYFAGQALAGQLANPGCEPDSELIAKVSVLMADTLLKKLGEK